MHHEPHAETAAPQAGPSIGVPVVAFHSRDEHGHTHPELLPVALTARAPDASVAILAETPEPAVPPARWAVVARAALARAAPGEALSPGPRAPPIA